MQRVKSFFEKQLASSFLKNVTKLTGATAFAQVISLVTAPFLYRIYDKEHYGTLGVFMAVTGVAGAISTMQYVQAVIIEKKDSDALQALWLVRIINAFVAILSLVLVTFFGDWLSRFFKNDLLAHYVFFIPVSIFFSGQSELFRVWANRQKRYNVMTLNSILTSILVPIVSITFGLIDRSPLGLFLGLLTSQVVPTIFMWWQLSKHQSFGLKTLHIEGVKQMAIHHVDFPRYSLPAEFINRLINQLPTFMLSMYSGAAAVGIYNLSVRMLSLPIQLLSSSVGEVFRQRAIEDYHSTGSCRAIFTKTLRMLAILSIGPSAVILGFGPSLFVLFFGQQWQEAGVYSQILCGLYFMRFIASPLSYVFVIAGKQLQDFFWHIWMLISSFGAFYIAHYFNFPTYFAIGIFSANYFIIYVLCLHQAYRYSIK